MEENKVMFYGIQKVALRTEKQQAPEYLQKTRQPSAVIVKGNPAYANSEIANKFYNAIADYLRKKHYSVTFDKGKSVPANADLWIGHSTGANSLRFAPQGTKALDLSKYEHPVGQQYLSTPSELRGTPPPHHFYFTKQMREQIDRLINEKQTKNRVR